MNTTSLLAGIAAVLFLALAGAAHASDASRGADLFDESCSECHSVASALHNKKGPSLYRVVGRKVASVPGFEYSPSLAGTGVVWSPSSLDGYLAHPKTLAPAGKMKFEGLSKPGDRADVIAFLTQNR